MRHYSHILLCHPSSSLMVLFSVLQSFPARLHLPSWYLSKAKATYRWVYRIDSIWTFSIYGNCIPCFHSITLPQIHAMTETRACICDDIAVFKWTQCCLINYHLGLVIKIVIVIQVFPISFWYIHFAVPGWTPSQGSSLLHMLRLLSSTTNSILRAQPLLMLIKRESKKWKACLTIRVPKAHNVQL